MIDLAKMVEGNIQRINDQNIKTVREKPSLPVPTYGTCSDCGKELQDCDIIKESGEFDYAGTHCTGGRSGTGNLGDVIYSRCCEADIDDLVEPDGLDFD